MKHILDTEDVILQTKIELETLVERNYQFFSTISIQPEGFGPADLSGGWYHTTVAN